LARVVVGIDIGHQQAKLVRLASVRRSVRLEAAERVALPQGALDSGRIVSRPALQEALAPVAAALRRLQPRVVVGMKSPDFVVRTLQLPTMAPAELRETARWELLDLLQIPAEQADQVYVDVDVLQPGQPGGESLVGVVAVRRPVVKEVVQLLRDLGLPAEIMDINAFAVARAAPRAGRVCYVDMGAAFTELYITTDGRYELYRLLPLGGERLTEGIAAAFGLPRDEAEARKRQQPLDELLGQSVGRPGLSGTVQTLLDAVAQTLEYLRPRSAAAGNEPAVDGLVLAGGGALQPGMVSFLQEELGYPTELVDVSAAVEREAAQAEGLNADGPVFAAALGLALRGLREP